KSGRQSRNVSKSNRSSVSESIVEENTKIAKLFSPEGENTSFSYQSNDDIYLEDYREGIPRNKKKRRKYLCIVCGLFGILIVVVCIIAYVLNIQHEYM
ncbi:33060_t:CDS:1, partial [Racocetra persica]